MSGKKSIISKKEKIRILIFTDFSPKISDLFFECLKLYIKGVVSTSSVRGLAGGTGQLGRQGHHQPGQGQGQVSGLGQGQGWC